MRLHFIKDVHLTEFILIDICAGTSFRILRIGSTQDLAGVKYFSRVSPFRKFAKQLFETKGGSGLSGNPLTILKYPHAKVNSCS